MPEFLVVVTWLANVAIVVFFLWVIRRGLCGVRNLQESTMTGTVRISEPDAGPARGGSGWSAATPGLTVYEGRAGIRADEGAAQEVNGTDAPAGAPVVVKVPWDTTGIRRGQVVTVLTAPQAPASVGRQLTVTKANHDAWFPVTRRMVCLTQPAGRRSTSGGRRHAHD